MITDGGIGDRDEKKNGSVEIKLGSEAEEKELGSINIIKELDKEAKDPRDSSTSAPDPRLFGGYPGFPRHRIMPFTFPICRPRWLVLDGEAGQAVDLSPTRL